MSELGQLGPEARAKVLALKMGVSLSPSARDGLNSEVRSHSEWTL